MLSAVLEDELAARVVAAVRAAYDVELTLEQALIRPSSPERGADYQSNVAMGLAKRLSRPSREVAEAIREHLEIGDIAEEPEVAGPGFLNFRLRRDFLETRLVEIAGDERLGIPRAKQSERVVVEYSSPNAAKEMHVGHLRSTIIGDALVRLLGFYGYEVIRQNHLGDWGTPFGMLIEHAIDTFGGLDKEIHIEDLNVFYQEARAKFDADPKFADRSRRRVVLLQGGDEATVRLWRKFVHESLRHFKEVYDLLGVCLTEDDIRGESFYNDRLQAVVDDLRAAGLAQLSDGAWCVFPEGFTGRDGAPVPVMVQKSDGGYTYDTTDLAAIRYRVDELKVDRCYYVVGAPQKLHFDLIFATARAAGWLPEHVVFQHVPFGSVLGEDGKMLRTRKGAAVRLLDLLGEGVDRARELVADREDLDDAEREHIARAVGIGAVKYADLSSDREKDYVFAWDRMLAMDGNTGVYMQYANARIRSILRRAGEDAPGEKIAPIRIEHPAERALALKLLQTPEVFVATVDALQPHRLCRHLYELATAFSGFYESCPVLAAETPELKQSRLELCRLTSRTLTLGLDLLGIESPERL